LVGRVVTGARHIAAQTLRQVLRALIHELPLTLVCHGEFR
jgi:hypothetical protein